MAERKKIGDKYYKKDSCSTSESAAQNRAEKLRKEGYNARVVNEEGKPCVWKRKPSAVSGKKKTGTRKRSR